MPSTTLPEPPTPETPANLPVSELTDEEKRKIADAFSNPIYSKNIAAIASGLGIPYSRVYKYVKKTPALLSQHPRKDPEGLVPPDESVIDRSGILAKREVVEMEAVARQNEKLQGKDWDALGLSHEDGQVLTSLELFSRWPLAQTIAVTHGGMMFGFTKLIQQFKRNAEALESDRDIVDHTKDTEAGEYDAATDLQKQQVQLSAEIRAIKAAVDKAIILHLKAKAMENEAGKPKGRQKPGFEPQHVTQVETTKVP